MSGPKHSSRYSQRMGREPPNGEAHGHGPQAAPDPSQDEPPSTRTRADLVDLADLDQLGANLTWVWHGWILQDALTLISADAGVGKTRFVGDLVRRIRHTEAWPDGAAMELPKDSAVVWLAADQQFAELGQIQRDFALGRDVFLNADRDNPFAGTAVDTAEDIGALCERIDRAGAKIVVVDTLSNATDADLCRAEEAKRLAVPLMRIAVAKHISVLLLFHANKEGKPLGRRMTERCRTVIQLKRPDSAADGVFDVEVSKSFAIKPSSLRGEMRNDRIDYAPPSPSAANAEPASAGRPPNEVHRAAEWIVAQLASGSQSVSRLCAIAADDAGIPERTFWRARDYLLRNERILQTDDKPKRIYLPEPGDGEQVQF